jgi:hypothetical protein
VPPSGKGPSALDPLVCSVRLNALRILFFAALASACLAPVVAADVQQPPKPAAPTNARPAQKKSTAKNKGSGRDKGTTPTGKPIPLGALSGTDTDALAQTLSSVFGDRYVVTGSSASDCQEKASDDTSAGAASGQSSSAKNTLCVQARQAAVRAGSTTLSLSPDFLAVVNSLDRDSFKGGILNSNYVIAIGDPGFAARLVSAFPHPMPDIDLKLVANNYIILAPSPAVMGQSGAASSLGKDAAGVKHDLVALYDYGSAQTEAAVPCAGQLVPQGAERCLAKNTVMLSVLDPREVALQAGSLFAFPVSVDTFPLNHSVSFLPPDTSGASLEEITERQKALNQARVIEQYQLYFQDQKQKQLLAALQTSSGAGSSAAANSANATAVTTTTTSTTKTSVSAPKSTQTGSATGTNTNGSPGTTAGPTTMISTKTSTTVQPPTAGASTGSGSAPGGTGGATPAAGGGGGGGASSTGAGGAAAGSGAGAGAASGTAAASAPAQPTAPSWSIDNIVRLYDYRDAAGIAAAINGMVSYTPNSRPIVQPLSDFGANDMIEILPSATQSNGPNPGYTVGDIERAISLFDLPRPQLSLQVWSYQISSRVRNPEKPYQSEYRGGTEKEAHDGADIARRALENIHQQVEKTNLDMIKALQAGMATVFREAASSRPMCAATNNAGDCSNRERADPFFDEDFREYLTLRSFQCITDDRYCLGYYDALDFPEAMGNRAINASLSQMILFIAATNNGRAGDLVTDIITAMRSKMAWHTEVECSAWRPASEGPLAGCFVNFEQKLSRIASAGNLQALRAAILDFLFNYKWTQNYPNDFVPYDLRRSAHVLDDLLQPIDNAFDQDIDDCVRSRMDAADLIPKSGKAGLVSQGMVQVAALSGRPAMVSGQVSNYFNITQTPSLSQVAQTLFGAGAGNSGGGGGGGGSQSSGANGLLTAISTLSGSNPYAIGGAAFANILSPQPITAQLTRGITLTVTPTSLDTASSAELNVSLLVNEPDGSPQSVNTTASTQDTLDRVATHSVSDTVRVQSLKLFDLSTLSMEITHPLPRTCVPLADDQPGRFFSYFGAVPLSIPCAAWRSVFGSIPMAGRLFEWPQSPVTVDNRSVAIVRAVVVPTAMDIGEGLNYESDRILDPITRTTETLFSMQQLGFKFRAYHRLLMQCVLNQNVPGCWPQLSTTPEDIRKPTTN